MKSKQLRKIISVVITLSIVFMFSLSAYAMNIDVQSRYVHITGVELVYRAGSPGYAYTTINLTNNSRIPQNAKVTRIELSGNMRSDNNSSFSRVVKGIYSYDNGKYYFTQQIFDNVRNLDNNMNVRQKWDVVFAVDNPMRANYITWDADITIYYE